MTEILVRSNLARFTRPRSVLRYEYRSLATQSNKTPLKTKSPDPKRRPPVQQTWLTGKLKQSPAAMNLFMKFSRLLGYGSPRQVAARRALAMYENLCVNRADEDQLFWQEECDLPPTFQSWFTITNLHVWLLVVRIRALPPPYATYCIQGLIDHFFLDVEDRIRAILQPRVFEASFREPPKSAFYQNSATNAASEEVPDKGERRPRKNAPESLVTRQMKIFREQWAGMGMALDLGIVKDDAELAGAVWRNLLGARGARGIILPSPSPSSPSPSTSDPEASSSSPSQPIFRRSINPTDSRLKAVSADMTALEAAETQDDKSGVHDYAPDEADKYLAYPELMKTLVTYIRKELVRLERLSDADITGVMEPGKEYEGIGKLKFGPVREQ